MIFKSNRSAAAAQTKNPLMLKAWRGVLYTVRPSVGGMSYAGAAQDRSREPACRAAQSVSDASCPSCPVRLAWRRRAVSSGPEVLVGPRGTAAETRGHGRPISIKGGGGGGGVRRRLGPPQLSVGRSAFCGEEILCGAVAMWRAAPLGGSSRACARVPGLSRWSSQCRPGSCCTTRRSRPRWCRRPGRGPRR